MTDNEMVDLKKEMEQLFYEYDEIVSSNGIRERMDGY